MTRSDTYTLYSEQRIIFHSYACNIKARLKMKSMKDGTYYLPNTNHSLLVRIKRGVVLYQRLGRSPSVRV